MNEWIDTKDKVPDSDDYVLVYLKYGLVRVGQYRNGYWHYCSGVFMTEYATGHYAVTHWMPLPSSPMV